MPPLIKESSHLSFPQVCPVSWSSNSSSTWNWWTWFLLQNALYFPFCHLSICCLTRHWRERRCPENQTCSAALSSVDDKYALIHSKSHDYEYTNVPTYIYTIYCIYVCRDICKYIRHLDISMYVRWSNSGLDIFLLAHIKVYEEVTSKRHKYSLLRVLWLSTNMRFPFSHLEKTSIFLAWNSKFLTWVGWEKT